MKKRCGSEKKQYSRRRIFMDKKMLLSQKKNGYELIKKTELKNIEDYSEQYKAFLDLGRTERECVKTAIMMAEAKGFKEYTGQAVKEGDKLYFNNRNKSISFAVIGKEKLDKGAQIIAAHIDSPRLDLKPNPLYEDQELAYLKTHYYGGIKKWQWVTMPMELHGVVVTKDGETVDVKIGEGDESKLVITDILIHLGNEQAKKTMSEGVSGEHLNLLIGSIPVKGEDIKEKTKIAILEILNKKYGITEDDFVSAELEAIPAYLSTDIGLDESMIGAYGHDDRVCAFAGLKAILDVEEPKKTSILVLADKEEIGSVGVTGMISQNFEYMMAELCDKENVSLRECFKNSFCLSCDVTAALDPGFMEVFDQRNEARLNYGMGICKYTGARGKSGASDASAETVAKIRAWFEKNDVIWQLSEMGKVDAGGGGTVALDMANRNIETIDAGVPVLSMHSPFEVVAKLDCYETYKGCLAVLKEE